MCALRSLNDLPQSWKGQVFLTWEAEEPGEEGDMEMQLDVAL